MKVILPVALAMTLALVVIGRLFGIPLPAGNSADVPPVTK